jgi:hypothetical protein
MKLIWEDIYKYGTQEEIEFLLEAFLNPAGFVRAMMNFKNFMESPINKVLTAKPEFQQLRNDIAEIQATGNKGIFAFMQKNQQQVNAFVSFVENLMKGRRGPVPVLIRR